MPFASIYGTIFSVSDKTPGMKTERGKKMGKLYGIGVGPGDPELLTLKAHRILNAADVIFVLKGGRGRQLCL